MKNLSKRYDILWTLAIFVLMIPAQRFELFTIVEDEFLAYRQILRWSFADNAAATFSAEDIVVVNIDEAFYERYGGFPLRRADYGVLAANLRELGAKVVGIDALMDYPNAYGEDPRTRQLFAEAGNVVLVSKADIDTDGERFLGMTYPTPRLHEVTTSGYANITSQSALRARMSRLRIYPGATALSQGWPFAIEALAMYWGVEPSLRDGVLRLGDRLTLPLDHGRDFYIDFPELPSHTRFLSERYGRTAWDVLHMDELHPDARADLRYDVADKIALVGDTSALAQDIFNTPVGRVYGVEIIADTIHTLLRGVPLRPAAMSTEIGIGLVFILLVLATSLIRPPATRICASLALFGAYLAFGVWVYIEFGLIIAMTYDLITAAIAMMLVNLRYYLAMNESLTRSERESADSNRMLALAFQGQGQLDLAFDKLRNVPLDESVADLLYNLALDYERKRQFNKAAAVYDYLQRWRRDYRGVEARMERARAIEANPLHTGAAGDSGATLALDNAAVEKPRLGRYEVQRMLGQGAFGVVYLGEDPRIRRTVAIKTLSLDSAVAPEQLTEVKERFFREARSAGRLTHPNIVAVHDVGEEQDLAYIAMEYLHGEALTRFTAPEALLPLPRALELVAQCAEGLAYAHEQGVVHRDVKPQNIMYDPGARCVKLTDFGIARLADANRTRTGTVLGTPHYMSPEQALGETVDGGSDLFSLGVVLFQLCTGRLPFDGESTASVMYQLVNEPHPDPVACRETLPAAVAQIIDHALAKHPACRYATGATMAAQLRAVVRGLESVHSE